MIRNKTEGKEEIRWKVESVYVDEDGGEIINAEEVINRNYIIHKRKRTAHVYKQTGTIKWTNICRKNPQRKLF